MKEEQFKKIIDNVCRSIFDGFDECEEVSAADVITILGTTTEVMANSLEEMTDGHIIASTFMGNFADMLLQFAQEAERQRIDENVRKQGKPNSEKYK